MKLLEKLKTRLLSGTMRELRSQIDDAKRSGQMGEYLVERLAELELSLEDLNWTRLTQELNRDLSRDGLKRILALSRFHFLKNPLINRAVLVQAYYIWAQGIEIEAVDEKVDEVVQAFLNNRQNRVELTSHQARTMKEMDLQVLGNLFFVFFPNKLMGTVVLRSIPVEEISDIVTSPDDSKEPWYYKRMWTDHVLQPDSGQYIDTPRTAYYPDCDYLPKKQPKTIGGNPVMWGTPVKHVRVGGLSDMKWGIPETYCALDWAKAHTEFMSDWATMIRSYALFAWNLVTKGGKQGVAAAKSRLNTTLATTGIITQDRNPPPVAGATFISGSADQKLEPIKTSGATTSADEGRQMKLMVSAGTGIPEHMFGDINSGNLATAKALDRPTELKFRDRQTLWSDVIDDILQYVISWQVAARNLSEDVDRTIKRTFPPILEHDVLSTVQAIVAAATLSGDQKANTLTDEETTRQLASALNIPDVDDLIDRLHFDKDGMLPPAEEPAQPEADPQKAKQQAAVVESLRRLRNDLTEINARTVKKRFNVVRDAEGFVTAIDSEERRVAVNG